MSHLTKMTPVTQMLHVWAIPNRYAEPGEDPFRYESRTDTPWQEGAVAVFSKEVTLVVPAGINLVAMAIMTLESAKKDAHSDYLEKLRELDARIDSLKLLTYSGDDNDDV